MTCSPSPLPDVADRLRPFLAQRVPASDVEDVLQDVFVRLQRGLPKLRAEDRFDAWLFQVARSAVAEHGRARARHPLCRDDAVPELPVEEGEDREAFHALAGCVALFVAQLPSPYREAVTLVELEGLTAREAAAMAGISVSGMKSRVQRGRAQLRGFFEQCCEIALDARNKPTDYTPRPPRGDDSCRIPGPCASPSSSSPAPGARSATPSSSSSPPPGTAPSSRST